MAWWSAAVSLPVPRPYCEACACWRVQRNEYACMQGVELGNDSPSVATAGIESLTPTQQGFSSSMLDLQPQTAVLQVSLLLPKCLGTQSLSSRHALQLLVSGRACSA